MHTSELPAAVRLSPAECAALSTGCSVCNAPPGCSCQAVYWTDFQPSVRPRAPHPRRLKDAIRFEERRVSERRGVPYGRN